MDSFVWLTIEGRSEGSILRRCDAGCRCTCPPLGVLNDPHSTSGALQLMLAGVTDSYFRQTVIGTNCLAPRSQHTLSN